MITSKRLYFISLLLFGLVLVPDRAFAKLPSISFAKKRLLKTRSPEKTKIKIILLGKTLTRYEDNILLFSGAFSVQKLTFSISSPSIPLRILALALGEQKVFESIEEHFGKLDKSTRVSVRNEALIHRYGSSPSISVNRESGALSSLALSINGETWSLYSEKKDGVITGAIYQSGLVVLRFTTSKE